MAMLQKASASLQCVSRSRSTSVRVSAAKQGETSSVQRASAFAAFAAAALLNAHPASAGVILEQPQLKKVLQSDDSAAPAPKREIILPGMRSKQAPKVAGAPAAKREQAPSVQGADLDPRALALPGSLALIAGGAFALTKVDEGFLEFMDDASCKNSGLIGAGYEPAIKGDGLALKAKGSKPSSRAGTKKVKASAKSGGTGAFSIGSLLNKD